MYSENPDIDKKQMETWKQKQALKNISIFLSFKTGMDKMIGRGKKGGDDSTGLFCGDAFCCCPPQVWCCWNHLGCVWRCKRQCLEAVPGRPHWTHACAQEKPSPTACFLLNTKCNKGTKMMVWVLIITFSNSLFQAQVRLPAQPRAAGSTLVSLG